jgi:serine/threonine-protein kinase
MVMEYLDGGDLAAWIKQRGALPIEQAVDFVLQACEAIAEAHALGIVHRDLKPANLFCIRRADGRLSIKVLDFGISKMSQFGGPGPSAMTHASALMGSPFYMSPEQMRSAREVNAQTDIWAIGIILFELLTGKLPFLAESLPELVLRITTDPPAALRGFRPDVPASLETVIRCCLEKDQQQRYPNVAEMALALLPFASRRGKASVERISEIIQAAGLSASALALPPSPQNAGAIVSPGTSPPLSRTARGASGASSRTGMVVAVAMAGIVLVVGGAGLVFVRKGVGAPPVASALATEPVVHAATSPPPSETAASLAPAPAPAPAESIPAAPVTEAGQLSRPQPPAPRPLRPSLHNAGAGAPQAPTATPPVAPPPAAKGPGFSANCDPPFTLDGQGHRHYKPECYLNK